MSAPTRLRRPSRGQVARGSAVGLGLLVASTAVAPAALAADDATDPVAPDVAPDAPALTPVALNPAPAGSVAVSGPVNASFGRGKRFDLAVSVDGDIPADLDLSGARFALTDVDGDLAATCVTDARGTCSINYAYLPGSASGEGATVALSDGTYTVTQVTAADGLTPVSGPVGTFTMDSGAFSWAGDRFAPNSTSIAITDVAQYSRHITASVVDAATGDPLPDTGFSLTGPAYAGAAEAYNSGTVTSDDNGLLTFDGWFRPGNWTLTPLRVHDGYELGDPLVLAVPPTPGFHAPATWAVGDPIAVHASNPPQDETPGGPGGSTDGDPTTPPPSVVVPPAAPSSSAPASSSARPRQRPVAPDSQDAAPPSTEPAAVPTATYDGRSSLPQDDRAPNTGPAPALLATPQLQTASSSFPTVGLVGIGVLFVAVVAAGVVFLRRRMLRG